MVAPTDNDTGNMSNELPLSSKGSWPVLLSPGRSPSRDCVALGPVKGGS